QPVEATNQNPEVQTPAPLSPRVDQAQPGIPQQMGPQGGPQLVPSPQHYTWPPLGDGLMIIPLQPSFHGSQPANQPALPQQPLLSMYVPTVLTNLPTGGGVQAASQAAGLTNQAQAGVVPTAVTPSGGVPQTERLASTGLQPDTDTLPVGLERAAQEAATVQSPVQPQLQPTQGNLI
uniref:Uncharacterized protein n=1 Tax=Seriola dumerili TaxID=41447 RepID=A0A3B4T923_SERDU